MSGALRFFKQVSRVMLGRGAFAELGPAIEELCPDGVHAVFLIDHVHGSTGLRARLPARPGDLVIDVDTSREPTTALVDALRDEVVAARDGERPGLVLGVGGGSTLDVAKAISVLLTNPGDAARYQGWDLVTRPALPKIAVPTLSGTGSEASRTAVLTAADRKYGINSDACMYDRVLLDPELLTTVPRAQRFHTGMDCYIHALESLEGSFIDPLGRAHSLEALALSRKVFLEQGGSDDELMVASLLGGAAVANSEVGVAHALSYGLSLVLGFRHGLANCIAFNQLEAFYPDYLPEFREMLRLHDIVLPSDVLRGAPADALDRMVAMTRKMARPLTSALGPDWEQTLTEERIRDLYREM